MKTETLKICIPEDYEIDTFDKSTGEVHLRAKPKNPLERIRTVADVLIDNNISPDLFEDQCEDLEPDEKAYRILKLLAKSLNEGWLPDWSNSSEWKYFPWFEMKGSSGFRFHDYAAWYAASLVGSRLCFKSSALAEHAGKNFTEVYKQFMVID